MRTLTLQVIDLEMEMVNIYREEILEFHNGKVNLPKKIEEIYGLPRLQ